MTVPIRGAYSRPMTQNQPQFSIIGDVSVDLVLGTLNHWPRIGTEQLLPRSELRAGGSAANSALAARHLGLSPRLIGAIGDDDLAQWLLLQLAGIRVELQTCASDTTMSVGLLHADGERTFLRFGRDSGNFRKTDNKPLRLQGKFDVFGHGALVSIQVQRVMT